jgi:predicted amidohydrolase YtcJ
LQTGLPRGLAYHGYRQMLEGGVPLAGSSDAPVVGFDVMHAIATAVNRRVRSGATVGAAQRISVADALRMYTSTAATALALDGEIGRLVRGTRADAVVLSADPQSIPSEQLANVVVQSTFAGGVEYRRTC